MNATATFRTFLILDTRSNSRFRCLPRQKSLQTGRGICWRFGGTNRLRSSRTICNLKRALRRRKQHCRVFPSTVWIGETQCLCRCDTPRCAPWSKRYDDEDNQEKRHRPNRPWQVSDRRSPPDIYECLLFEKWPIYFSQRFSLQFLGSSFLIFFSAAFYVRLFKIQNRLIETEWGHPRQRKILIMKERAKKQTNQQILFGLMNPSL